MSTIMCMARYVRSEITGNKKDADVYCQYVRGHSQNVQSDEEHSWQSLKEADEDAKREVTSRRLPPDHPAMEQYAEMICEAIEEGALDPYLEIILSFGHERKRTLRGSRTFGSRRRFRTP